MINMFLSVNHSQQNPTHPKALLITFKESIREQIEPLVTEAGIAEVSIEVRHAVYMKIE